MNAKTIDLLDTCLPLLKLFERVNTAQVPGLTEAVANLAQEVERVNSLAVQHIHFPAAVRAKCDRQMDDLMELCLALAGRVLSHAHRTSDMALAKSVRVVRSDFTRVGRAQRIVVAQHVHNVLAGAVERLGEVGIAAAEVTELHAVIQVALEAAVAPRAARANHAEVTAQLRMATRRIMELLRFQIDPLMHALRAIDPALFSEYCRSRRIIRRRGGRRKTTNQAGSEAGEIETRASPTLAAVGSAGGAQIAA